MRILKLTAENIKKLKAVEITPDGNLVQITGPNGAGKTSVLDSIVYAFSGGRHIEAKPIRDGQDKAAIQIDCGDFVINRSITPKGAYLSIETKDGDKKKSPQKFLDDLVGRISFDPLEFMRKDAREQKKVLMDIVPESTRKGMAGNRRVQRQVRAGRDQRVGSERGAGRGAQP
jgi:hypothetical protein